MFMCLGLGLVVIEKEEKNGNGKNKSNMIEPRIELGTFSGLTSIAGNVNET